MYSDNLIVELSCTPDNISFDEIVLKNDDLWSWCVVQVSVYHKSIPEVKGIATLCGCSYANEREFRESPYYTDLVKEATANYYSRLDEVRELLQ